MDMSVFIYTCIWAHHAWYLPEPTGYIFVSFNTLLDIGLNLELHPFVLSFRLGKIFRCFPWESGSPHLIVPCLILCSSPRNNVFSTGSLSSLQDVQYMYSKHILIKNMLSTVRSLSMIFSHSKTYERIFRYSRAC